MREGYLLHYGEPRVVVGADADLRLLAGDYLYALGLERLAGLGDLPAVRELSDLISLGAQLNAEASGPAAARGGGGAVAGERDRDRRRRRRGARRGEVRRCVRAIPEAEAALEAAATEIAARAGLAEALASARIAIDFRQSDAT